MSARLIHETISLSVRLEMSLSIHFTIVFFFFCRLFILTWVRRHGLVSNFGSGEELFVKLWRFLEILYRPPNLIERFTNTEEKCETIELLQ